jgi:hypothetical protein
MNYRSQKGLKNLPLHRKGIKHYLDCAQHTEPTNDQHRLLTNKIYRNSKYMVRRCRNYLEQ